MQKSREALTKLGWTPWFEEAFLSWQETDCFPGRVIGMQKQMYTVLTEKGELTAKVTGRFIHEAEHKGSYPVVGDWVVLDETAQTQIKAVLPRKSRFARKMPIRGGRKIKNGIIVGGTTEEHIIAANIDIVFIVTGLDHNFEPRRIERYLTLSADSGAQPVIILNKADLHVSPDPFTAQITSIADKVPVHAVSAETGLNMHCFSAYMRSGITVVFLGSSGVGKSTLTNRLLGQQRQKTNLTSKATGKGRHTTTSAELITHGSGCMIIDTPGLRELQLWCDENAVAHTFDDIVQLENQCKFRNCTHTNEPGCAIRAALAEGELRPDRLAAYSKQVQELHRLEARQKQLEARKGKRR